MKKRLTIHLANVPHTTIQVEIKGEDDKKIIKDKKILVNTLSFILDKAEDAESIVMEIAKKQTVTKHYLSNIN